MMTLLLWQITALLGFGALLVGFQATYDPKRNFRPMLCGFLLLATVAGLVWKISELLW